MKVRDLLEEINLCKKEYGPDFLDWNVYTEQCTTADKEFKRTLEAGDDQGLATFKDSEGCEYFKCYGSCTKYPKGKAFTVNVNY